MVMKDINESIMELKVILKNARKDLGYTLKEVSDKTGVSIGTISELENNVMKKNPSLDTCISLANFYNCWNSIGNLVSNNDEKVVKIGRIESTLREVLNNYISNEALVNSLVNMITLLRDK